MTENLIEKLNAKFPAALKGHQEFRDQRSLIIDAEQFHDVALFLRDDEEARYNLLIDIYGTDRHRLGQSPRFAANYELYSIPHNRFLSLVVGAPENGSNGVRDNADELPTLPSVTDVWPTANWLERETYDLMGIRFANHPGQINMNNWQNGKFFI